MAVDVFGRYALQWGGSFAADSAIISFSGGNLATGVGGSFTENEYRWSPLQAGMLSQQIQYQYLQRITRLYEIGSAYAYYVAGRPEGNGECQRVVGPRPILLGFYRTFGNVCLAGANMVHFMFRSGCFSAATNANGSLSYVAVDGQPPQLSLIDQNKSLGTGFTLSGFLMESVAHSVQAETMLINETFKFLFLALIPFGAIGVDGNGNAIVGNL